MGELTPEDAELLYEMDVLALQLSEVLTGPPARIGLTQLLTLMRFITAPSAKLDRASLRDELGSLRDDYERAGVQIARIAYASGVIFGFFSLCAVAIVVGAVSRLLGADPHALAVALTAILGAGSAATLSAFVRMGLGGSLVRHPIGRGKMRILGGLRPVVGGVLGLFVWLLLSWFGLSDEYLILAAVVSGFGERFFLIMLEPGQGHDRPRDASRGLISLLSRSRSPRSAAPPPAPVRPPGPHRSSRRLPAAPGRTRRPSCRALTTP